MTGISLAEAMDKAAAMLLAFADEGTVSFEDAYPVSQVLRAEHKRLSAAEVSGRLAEHAAGAGKAEQAAFWEARPELKAIRDTAHCRKWKGNPWAFLGSTLAHAVAAVPHEVVLPQIGGPHASLNLFIALVGQPGQGKDKSAGVAPYILPGAEVYRVNIGSGEGISHQYREYVPGKRGEEGRLEWVRHGALFEIGETATLKALQERSGSTLDAELRKAWMGQAIGFAYSEKTKRVPVPAQSYRLCAVLGIHPALGSVLLSGRNEGTPQRCLFFPVTDPDAPQDRPPCPEPLRWNPPRVRLDDGEGEPVHVVDVAGAVVGEIDAEQEARSRGQLTGSDLDAHATLSRLKVAAALGILRAAQQPGREYDVLLDADRDGVKQPEARYEVTEKDWQLARVVMGVSDLTRGMLVTAEAQAEAAGNEKRGRMEGERQAIAARTVDGHQFAQVAAAIVRKLRRSDGWAASSELRHALRSDYRKHFDDAIEQLTAEQMIAARDTQRDATGHGGGGTEYRLA